MRFSTPDQIKGDSLRRQIESSSRYAAAHNLTLDETLNVRDLGVSAFKGKNFEEGALGQFMIPVDEGRIAPDSYLIVELLDRLSRLAVTDALAIFQAIIGRSITIVTLTDSAVDHADGLGHAAKRRPGGTSCFSSHVAEAAGRQPAPGRQHLQPR